ncbi:MAG: hypothetical protein KF754_14435 [Planctomycetes bacterium]|nr:hypothetical protein [Planctomycetota bacterium]
MRPLLLIVVILLAASLPGQANEAEKQRRDWELYEAKLREVDGGKEAAARRKILEDRRVEQERAEALEGRKIDWFPILFIGTPLALIALAVLAYLVWKARTPQVHCPRCHWSGKESEASRLGLAPSEPEVAMGLIGDQVAPGVSLAMDITKAFTAPTCCPRCGAHPLVDHKDMAAPLPPRRGVRPRIMPERGKGSS